MYGKGNRRGGPAGPPLCGGGGLHPLGCGVCKGGRGEDCEAVSRPLSDKLDEADPIEGSYTFEVSSAGADRALKKPEHFAQFQGAEVEVRLYRAKDGRKDFIGLLQSWQDGDVTLEVGGAPMVFTKQEVAQVRLYPRF